MKPRSTFVPTSSTWVRSPTSSPSSPRITRPSTAGRRIRTHVPFSVYGSARDAWDLDGYRRAHDAGVTHLVTMPWYFYAGADADCDGKVDGIERFAEDIIAKW